MNRFDAVIFDLDGTLLNTLRDLADSVNGMLEMYGFPTHTLDAYRFKVGNGIRSLVQRSLPPERLDLLDEALAVQKQNYRQNCTNHTHPYDGIMDLLGQLKIAGVKLGVLSNKHHLFTGKIVRHYFGDSMFEAVVGHREGWPLKPDPASVLEMVKIMGIEPERCVFVGDSAMDMQTALAGGMYPVGVLWGFRPENELREAGAAILVKNCEQLLKTIVTDCNIKR